MNFERIEEMPPHGRSGSLPGSVTLEQLTEVFGAPHDTAAITDGKSLYEWRVRFDDGVEAAIWDSYGTDWSIGGLGAEARVREEIEHGLGIKIDAA